MFVENHRNNNYSPYKFNGKELDAETGYYYYGARYYNPRVSLWLNVDPLADYNPFYNDEHYIDGEHNGGVYNSGNNNPYIYCYQNPVIFVDPNGKQNYSSIVSGKFSGLSRAVQDGAPRVATQAATVGAVGVAAVLDVFVTKGWASRGLLAYSAGNAAHSMQMQTYWRDRGNETEAQKYEAEGAAATKDLVIWGGLAGVGGIAKGLKTLNKSNYVTKGTKLGEEIRKLTPNGKSNPTIFENGKPKFRVHKPGEHGAPNDESYIDVFEEGVNPNNGQTFNIPKTQKFDKKTYKMLKKAVNQKGGFDARTRNGNIINTK